MADNYPTFNALAPTLKAPPRNAMLGLLADALSSANAYATKANPAMPGGVANPPLNTLAGLLGLGGVARTVDRMSYGEPLTNAGKANVPYLPADTVDAISAALGLAPAASRAALKVSDKAVQAITRNPQATAMAAIDYGRQMVPANPITVWHGSPHKFDKFDSSKIGTGEGAQAYGHGLYLAESPETAAFYREKLTSDGGILSRRDALEARSRVLQKVAAAVEKTDPQRAAKLRADAATFTPEGALYKVDLPDEAVARMLDWDAPLSEQPEAVRRALDVLDADSRKLIAGQDPKGAKLYELLASTDAFAGSGPLGVAASKHLRTVGVPGIRYLDGGSRGAGGTSNFVVFPGEENILSILERNGVPTK